MNKIVRSFYFIDEKFLFNLFRVTNILFRNFTFNLRGKFNYNFQNYHYIRSSKNDLTTLCEKYGSDKGYSEPNKNTPYPWKSHSYTNIYHNLFGHCRDSFKLVLECGIGTNNPLIPSNMTQSGKPGASLRAWRDYFPNAQVYGCDIDKDILFEEERIKTYYVNQLEKDTIQSLWDKVGKNDFDLIIDDGLHTLEAGVTFFENSFSKLKKGGVYIIEDIHFSFLQDLSVKLSKYNPEVIVLNDNNSLKSDNNIIVIRKS